MGTVSQISTKHIHTQTHTQNISLNVIINKCSKYAFIYIRKLYHMGFKTTESAVLEMQNYIASAACP